MLVINEILGLSTIVPVLYLYQKVIRYLLPAIYAIRASLCMIADQRTPHCILSPKSSNVTAAEGFQL